MAGIDMEISPNTFKSLSEVLQSYSENFIKENLKTDKQYDYAIDLGSGLGNIVKLLHKNFKINSIYGIDIDQNMVEFARRQTTDKNIRFVTENLANDWPKLNQEIKDLEGKIGLIYSSFVLDFVAERKTMAKNFKRLLAPGGEVKAIVVCLNDRINTEMTGINVPTAQQQLDLWLEALRLAGLSNETGYFSKLTGTLTKEEFENTFASVTPLAYEIYMTESDRLKQKQILNRIKENMINDTIKYTDETIGTEMVGFEHNLFIFKAIKQ